MVRYYSKFLHATWLGWAVGEGIPWLAPALAVVHQAGMILLIGAVSLIDLRILGIGRDLPVRPLQKLLAWSAVGFVLSLVSGVGVYAGDPTRYQNWPFLVKMLCIAAAGLNGLLFYTTGLHRRVLPLAAGESAPPAARLSALVSLMLWFAVIFWARVLSFLTAGL